MHSRIPLTTDQATLTDKDSDGIKKRDTADSRILTEAPCTTDLLMGLLAVVMVSALINKEETLPRRTVTDFLHHALQAYSIVTEMLFIVNRIVRLELYQAYCMV